MVLPPPSSITVTLLSLIFINAINGRSTPTPRSPNFVLILTDDQDLHLNGLVPMNRTLQLLAERGVTFRNAFVNTPICCPSRSTLLTGKYMHNTGVVNNSVSGNCCSDHWQAEHEPRTIAAVLHGRYKTFYAGKYMNQYGYKKTNGLQHVPVGYDWWVGLQGNSRYYNYTLSINGSRRDFDRPYFTDLIKDYALSFLNQRYVKREPFFMILAPPAPHAPFTPAPRHASRFPDAKALRNPAFNYTPEDKHWLMKMKPTSLPDDVDRLDSIQRNRFRTLLSVDELVDGLISKLKDVGVYDDTYVIFTSDNGFHIGQFTQPWDKRQPYQSDINVPFMISGRNVSRNVTSSYPVSSVDLAPTIFDLAGVVPEPALHLDGSSFKDELFNRNPASFNRHVLVEYRGEANMKTVDSKCPGPWRDRRDLAQCSEESWCKCEDSRNNTYTCVVSVAANHQVTIRRTTYFKFCHFEDSEDFIEAYDLNEDPFELVNIFKNLEGEVVAEYSSFLNRLKTCCGDDCVQLSGARSLNNLIQRPVVTLV